MKLIFCAIPLFYVLFLNTAHSIERYIGNLDTAPQSIQLKFKNFNGYHVEIDKLNPAFQTKSMILDNKLKLEIIATSEIETQDYFEAKIEIKLGNKMKLTKAEARDRRNGPWQDIRYMDVAGFNIAKAFSSGYELYYNTRHNINKGNKYSPLKFLKAIGITDPEMLRDFDKTIEDIYRGTTCYKNRRNYLIEHFFDNNYAGYSLHDSETGLRSGGYLELTIWGETFIQDFSPSYVVGLRRNCQVSEVTIESNKYNNLIIRDKLTELKSMLDEGLISQDQYDEKSSKILDDF